MFSMRIETDSAAIEDDAAEEVARILEAVAGALRAGYRSGRPLDVNGNTVGRWSLSA